jgi:sialic acid synthase SpsE/uncharacterized protein (UPF0276 family)
MVDKIIQINDKIIGENQKTFIIAEIGINHNGDLDTAKKLILEAKRTGADAVKLQTYITEKRVPKDHPVYDILKQCELSEKDTEELFNFANSNNLIAFSTPFDDESVDLLVKLKTPLIKIASFDIVNLKLLEKIAKTNIPVIMSRGMSTEKEINTALEIFKKYNTKVALLHCVSSYPVQDYDSNLKVIRKLQENYDCPVGYSDHTLGIQAPILAVAAGATIIEKHFTLDRNQQGPDHKCSADPRTFEIMVKEIKNVESIIGSDEIRLLECEKGAASYRRPSNLKEIENKLTRFKIVTPISSLFENDKFKEDIISNSNLLELRDNDISTKIMESKKEDHYIYHSELNLLAKMTEEEEKRLENLSQKYFIDVISFHLSSRYQENKLTEQGIFMGIGTPFSVSEMKKNVQDNVKKILEIFGKDIEILVENNNYLIINQPDTTLSTDAYEKITDGDFISEIVNKNNLGFLLDIAHAQITAINKKIDFVGYLISLPLERCKQIHLSKYGISDGRIFDGHRELQEEDWEQFDKIIKLINNLKYVTIEYYKDSEKLLSQLKILKEIQQK